MPEQASKPPKITIIETPPRPATGDGEVIVEADGKDVVFQWNTGKMERMFWASAKDSSKFANLRVQPGEVDAIWCLCCLVDDVSGAYVCVWQACGDPCGPHS
ncbi:hypothetical protein [Sphaerisporangium sp. TRM90804]|uniref:hypothetical protein n=1 Tax=Sphaerisporangium sp. TRM90804 TaxID=3031113 RepID=UPI00244AA096|nr:hypothetical protein [Sphaerisporangium sp. TRM90804]MDH2425665.1 hypothetical protein [Sphaerisporangium sp. TRM90804]